MKRAALRRSLGFAALVAAIFSFVSMQQVGDGEAEPLRLPYSGETYSDLTPRIVKDGFYLVQLEVSRKTQGEDIREPAASPLDASVARNGKEIGSATRADWYAQEDASFCFYGFSATKGQSVQLSVKPGSTLTKYRTHLMHLSVQRDESDYGVYMWQEFGWFVLVLLFLLFAAGFLKGDLKALFHRYGFRPK